MEQKRQRDLEIWRREDEFIALWRSVYRGDVRRRKRGRGEVGEGNQTGWTMRAHTDALCLMSRWHFCSPSPPHRPALAGDEWAERKRREVWEETQRSLHVLHSRSQAPDKVRGQGSCEGQPIRRWGKSGWDQVSLPKRTLTFTLRPDVPSRPHWPSFCLIFISLSPSLFIRRCSRSVRPPLRRFRWWKKNWAVLLEFLQGSLEAT